MNDRQSLKEPGFIHRFIPADAEGAPTLLLLHGTGGDEDNLIELGRLVAPGAALLSPRGKVLENGMPRFFRRRAEGVFDLEDLRFRTVELAEFVDTAARAYGVEPSSMVAAGYSNGANIAASLLLLKPGALAAAVLFHAMVPIVPDPLPDLKGVPVFLTGGKQDTMIAPRETERLARLLESAGASVQLAWQPGGHGLSRPEMEAAREWLRGI